MPVEPVTDDFTLDLNQMEFSQNNGYLFFYQPGHPLAGKNNGMVAVHRHLMSVFLNRWLTSNDVVLFLNGDRSDVRMENLKLTTRAEIAQETFKYPPRIELICPQCNTVFTESPAHAVRRQHCSRACAMAGQQKFQVTPQELEKLVWEMPTVQTAKRFGVSDKAIEKRCKKWGISKPPPGYWAKRAAGQLDPAQGQDNPPAKNEFKG